MNQFACALIALMTVIVYADSKVQPVPAKNPAAPAKVQPPATPAKTKVQPPAAPAKVQPPAAPAKVQPPAAPAKVQPPAAPAKVQPPAASAKVQPPEAPAKVQPPVAPAKTQQVVSPTKPRQAVTPQPQKDAVLAAAAANPVVVKIVEQNPDGCQILFADDGSVKLVSVGTGVYDFNDCGDIQNAREEAIRNARAHIVKFLREDFATEAKATTSVKKAKTFSQDGKVDTAAVSQEQVRTMVETFTNNARQILSGVVVLKDETIPSPVKGGVVRVMAGVSVQTLGVAETISNALGNDRLPPKGAPVQAPSPSPLKDMRDPAVPSAAPAPSVRRSRGIF